MILAASLLILLLHPTCFADTFTHRQTNEVLHGYATDQTEGLKTFVQTQEKGMVTLNLAAWDITSNRLGRNNKVIILTLDNEIMLDIETIALEQAIAEAANEGPLFILLEIDTPGGRTDFAQRICAAITQRQNRQIIAFIKGGKYAGALSSGAAIALACDKIYMANNTTIGAAAGITFSKIGQPQDLKQAFGEIVSEKFTSAWRAYFASLAERNNRPGLLARAMVDKDIEVIEVQQDQKRLFIQPVNKTAQQKIVHTWSKKGSLLTLTADEAVQSGIADQVINSQREVLQHLKATEAEIIINDNVQKAAMEFQRAKLRFNKLKKSLDLKVKQSRNQQTKPRALRLLRGIRNDYKNLIKLAKNYPDLHTDVELLQWRLNSVEAMYQKAKMPSR